MTNFSGDSINGIGASVYGYGQNEFVRGTAVANYLNTVCVSPGQCFGGLDNFAASSLSETSIGASGDRVQIALSAQLATVSNVGAGTDQGIDQSVGTAMFSLTFRAVEVATFVIGTGYQGDGVIPSDGSLIQAQGATFSFVVPEPGTALLMGLGFAGMAARGRRERSAATVNDFPEGCPLLR